MMFFQHYPRFTRFECKVFLDTAMRYFDGACARCMIDNTHVVVLEGTGKSMVPVPEMVAFGERYGFAFAAHEKGDANRSARVEGPFHFIENNFLAGRTFSSWDDLNKQARAWCDVINAKYSTKLRASRRDLFATEYPALRRLPAWLPPIYRLHSRIVDSEGYLNIFRARYSVPYQLIGRQLEARETADRIEVYQGPRLIVSHAKSRDPLDQPRVTLPEHRPPRGTTPGPADPCASELLELQRAQPRLEPYAKALVAHCGGRATLPLRRLASLARDYPHEALLRATDIALHYRMFDLERLERMTLRQVADEYFVLSSSPSESNDDHAR
jgi:hypothetical protein